VFTKVRAISIPYVDKIHNSSVNKHSASYYSSAFIVFLFSISKGKDMKVKGKTMCTL